MEKFGGCIKIREHQEKRQNNLQNFYLRREKYIRRYAERFHFVEICCTPCRRRKMCGVGEFLRKWMSISSDFFDVGGTYERSKRGISRRVVQED